MDVKLRYCGYRASPKLCYISDCVQLLLKTQESWSMDVASYITQIVDDTLMHIWFNNDYLFNILTLSGYFIGFLQLLYGLNSTVIP